MWIYEKRLQHPVDIKKGDLKMAKAIMAQLGGPDSELSAALRYLSQRYSMPTGKTKALLNDIGTEEMAHLEMIGTMVYQLMKGSKPSEIKAAGLEGFYTQHDHAVYPADANGVPWTAAYIQSIGDPVTDLYEDLAAEQKARTTYEHLMNLTNDPDVLRPLGFLWQREIVHFQRFGEALNEVQEHYQCKNIFY